MNTTNKEIDIFELYRRTVNFIKRRWLLVMGLTIIGLGIGFVKERVKGPRYEGVVIISSEILDQGVLYEVVYPVINSEVTFQASRFSKYLNADPKLFENLKSCTVDTTVFS